MNLFKDLLLVFGFGAAPAGAAVPTTQPSPVQGRGRADDSDDMLAAFDESMFSSDSIGGVSPLVNPATGLSMLEDTGIDVGGNAFGVDNSDDMHDFSSTTLAFDDTWSGCSDCGGFGDDY
jgi:hypothetical protein